MSVWELVQVCIAIGLGGAAGALLRWSCALLVVRHTTWPPWTGVLAANCLASLLIGMLATVQGLPHALLVGGLCGALSTFSTFAMDIALLWIERKRLQALRVGWLTCLGGFGCTWVGLLIGGAL
jgi:CrcB protein